MRSSRTLLVFAASLSCLGSAAFADELNWIGNGADNDIATLENWDGTNGPPAAITTNDTLTYLYTGGSHETIAVTDSLDVAGLQVQVAPSDGTSPSILHSAGTLSITALSGEGIPTNTGILLLATENGSSGSYQLTGGSLSISGGKLSNFGDKGEGIGMVIGHDSGNGSFSLSGTASLISEGKILVGSSGGTGTFTQTGGTVTTKGLIVGEGHYTEEGAAAEGTVGSYQMTGGTLIVNDQRFTVGRYGTGTFIQDGGTVNANGGLYIGDNLGTAIDGTTAVRGNGTYELKNNGTLGTSTMMVGWCGEALFTQDSGTVTATNLYIGQSSDTVDGILYRGEGTYNMTGGSLSVTGTNFIVGSSGGIGTLTVNGGTVTHSGLWLVVGKDGNADGTINLISGSFTTAASINLGEGNGTTGTINISGGTFSQTSGSLTIGKETNGVGHLNITGGSFSTTGTTTLATREARDSGSNLLASTITVSGSSTTATFQALRIAQESTSGKSSYGIFTAKDGAEVTINGNLIVAFDKSGIGEFNVENGAEVEAKGDIYLGYWDNAVGTLNISGGVFTSSKSSESGTFRLGQMGGSGVVNQTGGVFNSLNSDVIIYASNSANGYGTWNLSGTGQTNIRRLTVGEFGAENAGAATFNLGNGSTGGTLNVGQIISAAGSNSSFIFNGGTLVAAGNATETGDGDFLSANLKNLVVQSGGGIINTNGKNISLGRGLTGSGNLTKEGSGTLTLKGDYTNYTGSINVTDGDIAFAAGAKVFFNVDGANTEADNAYTFANGSNITLDDSVILQIALSNESSLIIGQTIDLFKGDSVNIANADLIQVLINSSAYSFSLNAQGQLVVNAIPEPSTYALFASAGLLGLVALRRRRK